MTQAAITLDRSNTVNNGVEQVLGAKPEVLPVGGRDVREGVTKGTKPGATFSILSAVLGSEDWANDLVPGARGVEYNKSKEVANPFGADTSSGLTAPVPESSRSGISKGLDGGTFTAGL